MGLLILIGLLPTYRPYGTYTNFRPFSQGAKAKFITIIPFAGTYHIFRPNSQEANKILY